MRRVPPDEVASPPVAAGSVEYRLVAEACELHDVDGSHALVVCPSFASRGQTFAGVLAMAAVHYS